MQVIRVIDASQGLLVIEGEDNGQALVAVVPVVSEVLQHIPADQRDGDGNPLPDAQPRRMTEQELVAYAGQVLGMAGAAPQASPHVLYES